MPIAWQAELRATVTAEAGHHRELVDAQIDGVSKLMHERWQQTDKAIIAALAVQKRAFDKAEVAISDRFHSVDEFRAVLTDQASRFSTRSEVETHATTNANRITELAARLDRIEGQWAGVARDRESRRQATMVIFAAVSILITVIIAAITIYVSTGR